MEKVIENIKKHKIKIGVSGVILLVILLVAMGIFFYIDYCNKQYEVEEVDNFFYYPIYENGKMGVIDTNGNVLIEPVYDNVKIPNPQKSIFVCKLEEKTLIFNDNKEELFGEYEEVTAIDIKGIASSIPYEKKVLRYKQNGKYGLISYEGKIITKPIYEEIKGLENKESEFLVKKDGKYGVINQKGARIIKPEYDGIIADGYYKEAHKYALSGYIVSLKTEDGYRYGYINSKRKKVLEVKYNNISRILELTDKESVYLMATRNGQVGIVKNGQVIVNHAYQDIEYDNDNQLFILQRGNNFGVVDLQGKEIIPLEYKEINIKGIQIQAIGFDEAVTYFDINGNKIVNVQYDSILKTENTQYFITINVEGKYGIMDEQNKVLVENTYEYLEYLYDTYFIASNEEGYLGVIDRSGNVMIDFQYEVLQKVDQGNLVLAKILKDDVTDIYSSKLEKIYTNQEVAIYSYDNYIEIHSQDEVQYFDLEGNVIVELSEEMKNNKKGPESIGPYRKVYYGYGESYYTKEINE